MNIDYIVVENSMQVNIAGRIDSTNAAELESGISERLEGITELILDFSSLRYIASAGLRVILSLNKKMRAAEGNLIIQNPNELVMDIFEATGFADIMDIRQK